MLSQQWTLAVKDMRLLIRDKASLFFTFIFPILYSVFFGMIMANMGGSEEQKLSILLVDLDQSAGSKSFVADLKSSPAFEIAESASVEAAAGDVRRGRKLAYVAIPGGFGEASERIFWGDPPRLEVGIDPSRKAEAGMLQGLLTREIFKGVQEVFGNPQRTQAMIDDALTELDRPEAANADPVMTTMLRTFLPALNQFMGTMANAEGRTADSGGTSYGFREPRIEINEIARQSLGRKIDSAYQITCPQGIIWGIMSCAASFAIGLVIERTSGTLLRLRTAPIGRAAIVGGKALACFCTTLSLAILILLIFIFGFGVRIESPPLLALAVVSVSICFVGIMMFLSVLGRSEQSAGGSSWAVLLVMAMLGGGMIPLAFMPPAMQTVSHVSPVKWSILAMEGAIWRGFSLGEMVGPCLILLAIGGVSFLAGERLMRRFV